MIDGVALENRAASCNRVWHWLTVFRCSSVEEELDRLAYRLFSIVTQLIHESLTPISLFIVVNDSVLYSARNTSARRLLVDLVSAISKVNPTRYHKASTLEE